MKGTAIILFCAFALALCEDGSIELNFEGCPVDHNIFKALPHEEYCNKFYNCDNGIRVPLMCPGELVFNPADEVCDWSSNVDCAGKGIYVPESSEEVEEEKRK